MTELNSHPMNKMSCDEVMTLWDAEVSGSLPSATEQALSGHLAHCPECQDFVKVASNLFRLPVMIPEDELDAAIRSVTRKAREERSARIAGIPRQWAMAAVAIAALAVIGITGIYVLAPDTPFEGPPALQCSPSTPTPLAPGVLISHCNGGSLPGTVENGEAAAGTASRDVRISLRTGAVGLLVDPNRPDKRRVTVATPHGDVRVKGTLFTVRVEEEDAWVEVFRGIVEVTPTTAGGEAYEVPSGYGAELASGRVYSLATSDARADRLRQILLNSKSAPEDVKADADEATPMSDTATGGDDSDSGDQTVTDSQVEDADAGGTVVGNTGSKRANKKNNDGHLHAVLQAAQSCLINQDWECARKNYRQILSQHSNRPESLPVLISLAKIELRHLGAPNDALTHYSSYQRRAPNGPLAEEALLGIAESHRRLGNTDRETESLRKFIVQYPGSAHIRKVRGRLKQLEQLQTRDARATTSG